MADSKIGITVPEDLISDLVRAEIVNKLSATPHFVEEIVKKALLEKENNYHNSKTKFGVAFTNAIQKASEEVIAEWIAANRDLIKKAFLTALNKNKGKAAKAFAESMIAGLRYVQVKTVGLHIDMDS